MARSRRPPTATAAQGSLRLNGYKEFLRAAAAAGKESKAEVRNALKAAADPVRADATRRFSPINEGSAAGYRVSVRQRGVAVDSSRRKTTGTRPDYGALQMRKALIPAATANRDLLRRQIELALDRIAIHFERN